MPSVSLTELLVLLPFLAVLAGLVFAIKRVARRARHGSEARRVRDLEQRVRELEGRR